MTAYTSTTFLQGNSSNLLFASFFNPAVQFMTAVSGGDDRPTRHRVYQKSFAVRGDVRDLMAPRQRPILPTGTARDYVEDDITSRLRYYFQPSAALLGSESTH